MTDSDDSDDDDELTPSVQFRSSVPMPQKIILKRKAAQTTATATATPSAAKKPKFGASASATSTRPATTSTRANVPTQVRAPQKPVQAGSTKIHKPPAAKASQQPSTSTQAAAQQPSTSAQQTRLGPVSTAVTTAVQEVQATFKREFARVQNECNNKVLRLETERVSLQEQVADLKARLARAENQLFGHHQLRVDKAELEQKLKCMTAVVEEQKKNHSSLVNKMTVCCNRARDSDALVQFLLQQTEAALPRIQIAAQLASYQNSLKIRGELDST